MKRTVAMLAMLGLALAACGGDDDSADPVDSAAQETTADATSGDDAADEPTDDGDDDATTADDSADDGNADEADEAAGDTADEPEPDPDTDDTDTDTDAQEDDGDGTVIRSIDDVPDECRELMADFLRDIEPIVSDVDWQNASLDDFGAIGDEFSQISEEYDAEADSSRCNNLEFAGDDDEFDLMIDFARQEAPGTVGFLEFLSSFGFTDGGDDDAGGGDDDDGDADDGGDEAGGADYANCDEAIDFVRGLIDQYDDFTQVPAAEIIAFSNIASVLPTCTPEQLEFFDSDELNAFLGE